MFFKFVPSTLCTLAFILNLLQMEEFNHQVEIEIGVLGEECSQMMKQFFKELREKK